MRILIVEDEQPAYRRLRKMILEQEPDAEISEQVASLSELSEWIDSHESPDLAFVDIQLADGSTLDYLEKNRFEFPVIFATAYSEHALEVFDAMSIDYLLKPVKKEELAAALTNYRKLKSYFSSSSPGENTETYKKRFRFRLGQNMRTVEADDIAYFYTQNKVVIAQLFDGSKYPTDYNLETLETLLDPEIFFRINRQYIINISSIQEMKATTKSRVIVTLEPDAGENPIVSSSKSRDFKKWLEA